MKFAILGETPETIPIAEALINSEQHSVTHVVGVDDDSQLFSLLPGAKRIPEWEALLADESVDAVLVSGNEDRALPPCRQIAGTGRPLIVVPSHGLTSAFAYELSLVRDENLVPLYPVLAHRLDPATRTAKDMLTAERIGKIVQVRLERTITTPDNLLQAKRDVETWLQPDADMLRWLAGAFTQVTALYQGKTDAGFANCTVNLAGESATDSSWVLSTGPQLQWKLTASGTDGTLTLQHAGGSSSLSLDGNPVTLPNGQTETTPTDWLTSLPESVSTFLTGASQAEQAAAWTDFTRSHEIVDSHRRSIKRRRTIDMHFETLSERSQFKTQMAAIGCGVLTYNPVRNGSVPGRRRRVRAGKRRARSGSQSL